MARTPVKLEKSLVECFANYRKQLRRAKKNLSAKSVHDLRIASRRLIAAFDLISRLSRSHKAAKSRKTVKKDLKQLSPLRDAQIQLKTARAKLRSLPALRPFVSELKQKEGKLSHRATVDLRHTDLKRLKKTIATLSQKLSKPAATQDRLEARVNSIRKSASVAVAGSTRRLNSEDPETFHRLRVRLKKFRYLLEFLQPSMTIPNNTIAQLRRQQKALGEIQDISVFIDEIEKFFEKQDTPDSRGAMLLTRRLKTRRETLIRRYLENFDQVVQNVSIP